MTWREDLRRVTIDGKPFVGASFRGVTFFVAEATRAGGRRAVTHEFPGRDAPFVEDLGRRARKFPVVGHVIGDDYLAQKDALLVALEDTEGPGQLIHPYYGTKTAICDTVTVSEKVSDGGMAVFSIDFIETPAQAPTPTIVADPAGQVSASADRADAALRTQFLASYSANGLPAFSLTSAQTALTRAAGALKSTLGPVITSTQELASLTSQVAVITAQASSLVRQPDVLIDQFLSAAQGLQDTVLAAPGAVMAAFISSYGADLGPLVSPTTATRQRELANQQALTGALRQVMAIEAARLAPVVPYASIEDATAARDQVAGLLEEQGATAGDTAYPALVDLRSQVLRAVPGGAAFARVVTVTRRVATPSLLLAYQLYGSVDLEGDILARNKVRHPGFLVGDHQVLSDG